MNEHRESLCAYGSCTAATGEVVPVLWGDFNTLGHPYFGDDNAMDVRVEPWSLAPGQAITVDDREGTRLSGVVLWLWARGERRYARVRLDPESVRHYELGAA